MKTGDRDILFHKTVELKKLTIRQKKSIMAGDIDIYISIERLRSSLRKEIDGIRGRTAFRMDDLREYKSLINELVVLENENRRLLKDLSESLRLEKDNIRKFRRVSSVYFSESKTPARPRFINHVT
ncbi:MAG: hypothetical protein JW770_06560 [Actinobacteria bacterium]|nr:hypothetical protein [Actinomycetota bacterium]